MFVRLSGLILLGICFASASRLHALALAAPAQEPTLVRLLLGLLTIACGCAGAALTMVGPKLFEPMPVPRRRALRWDDPD